MKKLIILMLFLVGCTHKAYETSLNTQMPNPKRLKVLAREFLQDIGGEEVVIDKSIRGFYFNPKEFQKKEITAYKKWRPLFAKAKNCQLAEMFQIDYQGINLLSLFSLPKTQSIKKNSIAAICLPSFSIPFEFDPKWILTYLSKGVHVLAINYENEEKTSPSQWEETCKQALVARDWLQKRISAKIVVLGKSLGAIPASYVAANTPNASLILENGIVVHPMSHKEWLKKVEGKILSIEKMNTKTTLHFPKHVHIMTVLGNHFGPFWGYAGPTWYENEKDQIKLLNFLMEP